MKRDLNHQNIVVHLSDAVADGIMDRPAEPESVLGDRLLPTYAGVLRSGIKVPYESGKNALTAKERTLYEKWTSEGRSPREIEKELKKDLRPTNVPYFSVYRSECKNNPEHADLIRALYANERGEIDRLRITFLSEKWWETIPHKLMAFRKSGLYCSSEPIGGRLIATRDPEMEQAGEGHEKHKREFKRNKTTLPCIPDECPIYQASGCRFSGVLHFMILGVPGTDVWRLPTTSWYSVRGIMEKINMFGSALASRGKSLIGIPFELFKHEAEISRWDPEKGRVRVRQWIIRIDCPELPLADLIVQHAGFGLDRKPQALSWVNAGRKRSPGTVSAGASDPDPAFPDLPSDREKAQKGRGTSGEESPRDREKVTKGPSTSEGKEDKERVPDASPGEMTRDQLQSAILGEVQPVGEVPLRIVQEYLLSRGKKLFKELSTEEAKELHLWVLSAKEKRGEERAAEKARSCSACHTGISDEVERYSMRRYQRPLCRSCQDNEKGGLPSQTTIQRKAPGQISDSQF